MIICELQKSKNRLKIAKCSPQHCFWQQLKKIKMTHFNSVFVSKDKNMNYL